MNKIYLDNAATTVINSEVLNEMIPYFTTIYGNANSTHSFGREARKALDLARDRVATAIGCDADEVYFTSGATESNNWAIEGIAKANMHKGNHIITSKIEHPSVLRVCEKLESEGFRVTYLDVDKDGFIRLDKLLHYIDADTILITLMSANNEVGTIQNIQAISNIAKEKNIIFHTDATQAIGSININVHDMNIDALSLSGHKLYGPKGVGALYVKRGIDIMPLILGGGQERNMRSGTTNLPSIVGLGKAIELTTRNIVSTSKSIRQLRDYFIARIQKNIDYTFLNGHSIQRLPNNVNISFGAVDGESIMMMLDNAGIAVSTGSACSAGAVEQSHVLKAMGLSDDLIHGAVRFSLSKMTTKEELDYVVEELVKCVTKLRQMSPIKKSQVGKIGGKYYV